MIEEIQSRMGEQYTKSDVRNFLKVYGETIIDLIREGNAVRIKNVGVFSPYYSQSRTVHTFNGIKRIPPMVRVRFKLYKSARDYINSEDQCDVSELLEMVQND